ncbi:MAG TPA: bifunctional aldolase/short-chain dehydrogenase [Polyangiaceae bacterium]|nr:bifunctional aldolase/short-chain dehydrogenase [Polyangiaceae bacterium]
MQSRWSDDDARAFRERYAPWGDDLALRVYTSRLLGRSADLVMHGGGNTSVKTARRDVFGEPVEAICVKGSGWDLDTIEPPGLPALRLGPLRALRRLEALSDEEMVNQQRTNLFDAASPNPSVETLLHAFLPHKFVDHTHADAILALTNQPGGEALAREALGERVALVPYVMPGFRLAKLAAEIYERDPKVEAMVLLKHGFFTFADDARASYEAHVAYVDRAERFLAARARGGARTAGSAAPAAPSPGGEPARAPAAPAGEGAVARARALAAEIAPVLRGLLAGRTGDPDRPFRRVILEHRASPEILGLLAEPPCERLAGLGPITPDHVIRTKATYLFVPDHGAGDEGRLRQQLGGLINAFRERYDAYFAAQTAAKGVTRQKLDPDPRVVLVPGVGLFAAGKSRKDAAIAADIAEHTLRVKSLAESLGGYEPLADGDLFDMEYWSLEQAKLGKEAEKPLSRRVALVTGAAGAIGVGVCLELAKAGAHVVLTDVDEAGLERARALVAKAAGASACAATRVDVTDEASVRAGFAFACRTFGGVDVVVPNAGIAHVSPLAATETRAFTRVVDVNLIGYFLTLREAARVLSAQGTGGDVVVNASKNVFGPGADFGAYSASKAAGHQLGKVAAIELAPHGIRVNMINADAVFAEGETPSGLWREIGADRARSKGIAPEALEEHYRERNLLRAKVTGAHVGRAVVFFASGLTPTTGATLPVDGGVAAAFPR